jgi:signal transduction histidine kinase
MRDSREFPEVTLPPPDPPRHPADDEGSGVFAFRNGSLVAVVVEDAAIRRDLLRALRDGPWLLGGADVLESAGVIVADATDDVAGRVRGLRRTVRADAAIVMVIDERRGPSGAVAAAEAAGAFACIRTPIFKDAVEPIMRSANATHAALTRVADLTRQLDLQSHLTTLGRFTAGLHHELKNPLAVVEMNMIHDDLQVLLEGREMLRALMLASQAERGTRERAARDYLARTEQRINDVRVAVTDARASLERMRRLFARLQNIVRRSEHTLEPVDVAAVVNEVRAAASQGVAVEVVAEGAPRASAVRSYVEEILMNLLSNALTAARALSSPRVRLHVYVVQDRVVLSVRDNGPGIAPDKLDKIFEPFYTTRRKDGAAGLGLAICREYATSMGAEISVWSAVGRGACFRLHLRRA